MLQTLLKQCWKERWFLLHFRTANATWAVSRGLGGKNTSWNRSLEWRAMLGQLSYFSLPAPPSPLIFLASHMYYIHSWWKWLIFKIEPKSILTDQRKGMRTPLSDHFAGLSMNALDVSALLLMGTSEASTRNQSTEAWCSQAVTVSGQESAGRVLDTFGPRDGWPAQPRTHSFIQPLRQGWTGEVQKW